MDGITNALAPAQTLSALPDQDSFYDVTDCLEQQGMENIMHKHMNTKGTEPDLKHQFTIYEVQPPAAIPNPFSPNPQT